MAAIDRSPQLDPYRAAVQAAAQQLICTAYGQAKPPTVQEVVVYEPAANPQKQDDVRRLVLVRIKRSHWRSAFTVARRIPLAEFEAGTTEPAHDPMLVEGLTAENLTRMERDMRVLYGR